MTTFFGGCQETWQKNMCTNNKNFNWISPSFFSDGKPVPDLLTEEETIKFLRLDTSGSKNPKSTLKYYRDEGRLRATRVGRKYRYMRVELLDFLVNSTSETSKNTQ